ncbi:MAG: Ca(2+)-dependent cysteine protease [Tremellales sp. Tagirdzhanova-0007]|nr:MAG: Ca(2+)-dependent cysteine protease [Tremellales sp. Tagirdzhanova-0007]
MSWNGQQNPYANNPPPPSQGWANAPPQPNYNYNSLGQNAHYPPPPSSVTQRFQGNGYAPPTGAPAPPQYHQTAAGYRPPDEVQQGYGAPYGPPPVRPPSHPQQYGPQYQSAGGGQSQPFFQYSQCTGRRKALCIGINYIGSSNALAGCINDAHNVQKFLIERYRYSVDDIVMLTDDSRNPRAIPTRANMIQAMHWLVSTAQPNDALFFHYSGHGGQTPDLDGDEDDGMDEVIYPVDFKNAGHIVDDEKGKIKEPNLLAEAGQGLLGAGMSYLRGDMGGMLSGVMGLGKQLMHQNSGAEAQTRQTKTSPADVIMWSGCKDSQTSADTSEAGRATGAMSYAFIAALTKYPQQSYVQLLNTIRDELRGRYDQKPQLSASHPIDTNILFIA